MEKITFKLSKNNLFFKNYLNKIVIFGLVFGIFLLNPNFAEAAQYGNPASTVSAGSWTAVGAATLHEATDEPPDSLQTFSFSLVLIFFDILFISKDLLLNSASTPFIFEILM